MKSEEFNNKFLNNFHYILFSIMVSTVHRVKQVMNSF